MTSCMSSKRSNHLGYASEACILYHSILQIASGFTDFLKIFFCFFKSKRNFCYSKFLL